MLAELLALASLATPLARVDEQQFTIDETKIVVYVDSPWPKALNKGWLPIFVRIENGEDRPRRVKLTANCWAVSRSVFAEVEVGANQTSSIELLFPVFSNTQNGVQLLAEAGSQRNYCPGGLGADEAVGPDNHSVLVLGSELPAAGTPERWTEEVSTGVASAEPGMFGGVQVRFAPGSVPTPAPPAATPNNIRVQAARFDEMPSRSEAYSSLDVVVLDTTTGLPEAQRLAPLIAWAKLGGALLVVGPRAEAVARVLPDLSPWMESRFAMRDGPQDEQGATNAWRFGLGSLHVDPAGALATARQREWLRQLVTDSRGIVEDPAGSRMHEPRPVIEGLFSLPLKAFALFLVLFAVVIGPVNFLLVKRTGRPAILLITIPLIAFVAALILFVIGVASQGLGVRVATRTLALLDQREHRASSAEVRMVFAGLSPGAGLAPRPGSSCYAIANYRSDGQFETPSYSSRSFRIDQTEGLLLSGAFIPSRTPFVQQILSEHAERARLAVHRQGAKLSIENGLGATIQTLLLRDAAGGYHRLLATLQDGASAELEPIAPEVAAELAFFLEGAQLIPGIGDLPPASYLASLEQNPFGDDCGVGGKEVEGTHHMFGVLALDSEEWR